MKNEGNPSRIIEVIKRAHISKTITIGFIGGSITQGAAATDEFLCYAARVYNWWKETFTNAKVKYVNAGIGATTSQFGVARAEEDLLRYDPDFVIVEYSVNDNDEKPYTGRELFKETYEGLIRKIYSHRNRSGRCPAVLIVHSVRYDNGENEEEIHSEIGKYYGIPCISMKELIYDSLLSGKTDFEIGDFTKDMLHPTDFGHGIVAGYITSYLDELKKQAFENEGQRDNTNESDIKLPAPLTMNRYENARRYNNRNSTPVLHGFIMDNAAVMKPFENILSSEVRDVFKNGWKSSAKGASLSFEFSGTELSLMYRKSVKKPAPVAYAVIDDEKEHRIRLDANFDEDWGDKAYMTTLMYHGMLCDDGIIPVNKDTKSSSGDMIKYTKDKRHVVTITIEEAGSSVADFYLINFICS